MVVVDFSGERRVLFDEIANAAMSHINGMLIDLIPYDSEFGRSATNNIELFY